MAFRRQGDPVAIRATYEGCCGICDEDIELDDLIIKVDDEWCHVECA